jgi:transcriptional regulator with XRE-family HTH domain
MTTTRDETLEDGPDAALRIGDAIRGRRHRLGLVLQDVADTAGISPGYLSLVERDKAVPTLTTLSRIATALGVGIDHFIARPQPTDCITRADRRERFLVGPGSMRYERLGADFAGHGLSSFVMTLEPGHAGEEVTHAGEEAVYILSGALQLRLDGETFVLEEGDSAHYDAARRHAWANPFAEPVRILWTGTIDLFGGDPGG